MPGASSAGKAVHAVVVVDLALDAVSSGVKLTWKSRLKSLPFDDTHLNCQPMRRRKRSISASGARETATKRDVAMRQVHVHAVGVVGHERAARAALLPARPEHEVLHQQLAAALEQVGERARALGRVEDVVLLDAHPGQRAALAGDLVAQAGQFLLARQQRLALGDPVVPAKRRGGSRCSTWAVASVMCAPWCLRRGSSCSCGTRREHAWRQATFWAAHGADLSAPPPPA